MKTGNWEVSIKQLQSEYNYGRGVQEEHRESSRSTAGDLYDFNFEDGLLSRSAAALQIGFGNGNNSRTHGRIFSHEIQINTTYQNPFAE